MALEKSQLIAQRKEIEIQIRRASWMNLPALIVFALGIYTKNVEAESLPSFLSNPTLVNIAMLGAGMWVISCFVQISNLAKKGNAIGEDIKRMEEREKDGQR